MGIARNLARVIADNSGAIAAGNLTNAVPADGSITNAKIASVAASKLTGTLPDANAPSGSVIQVVSMRTSTAISWSNTEQSTGLSASITPSSASNKILVIANNNGFQSYTGSGISYNIYRGATLIYMFAQYYGYPAGFYGAGGQASYLDSPATTSSVTYDIRFQRSIGSGGGVVNGDGSNSFLTLLEIAA